MADNTISEMRQRIEELEAQDVFRLLRGDVPPNGVVSSTTGVFYLDRVLKKVYLCIQTTEWVQL